MIIECGRCVMVNTEACNDCVVSVLVGESGILALTDEETRALEAMSRVSLVSPIRLVEGCDGSAARGP